MLWKKPSGLEIETVDNKETVAYCLSLGWEDITPEPEIEMALTSEVLAAGDPSPFADNPTIPSSEDDPPE